MKFDLSIVLPVLIHKRYLMNITRTCIDNLRFFTHPYSIQIILVHNNSDLFNIDIKECLKENDIYIPNKKNEHLGKCFNQGFQQASSNYISMMSNDIIVHQDWFKYLKEDLDTGDFDIVAPYYHHFRAVDKPIFDEKIENNNYLEEDTFTTHSICNVFKRETYEVVGPFDENLIISCDRDYQKRLAEKKMYITCDLRSNVTHIGSMTWLDPFEVAKDEEIFGWNFYEAQYQDNIYLNKKWENT